MEETISFLLKARAKTYAGGSGKVSPALDGSTQLEYQEGDFLYRDIYYVGPHNFIGLETIYRDSKPAWSMSYYGDWTTMTEEETDNILRPALLDNAKTARTNKKVEWSKDGYNYLCDGQGTTIDFEGIETITKGSKTLYEFKYKGGSLIE